MHPIHVVRRRAIDAVSNTVFVSTPPCCHDGEPRDCVDEVGGKVEEQHHLSLPGVGETCPVPSSLKRKGRLVTYIRALEQGGVPAACGRQCTIIRQGCTNKVDCSFLWSMSFVVFFNTVLD